MKCLMLLGLVTLVRSQSHVQVTIGKSSYELGNKIDLPHPATPVKPTPEPYRPRPTPAPYRPAPVAYKPAPYVPVQPVHVPHLPAVHVAKVPVVHAPQYHAAPAYGAYKPRPGYNCTVEEETVTGEVCVPTLQPVCSQEKLMIQRIVDKQQCQDITRTVCTEMMETAPNTVCTYMYENQPMTASATTFEVSFEKMCKTQMVTVCEPSYGYSGYGKQACKEVSQETCYNAPKLMPMEEMVTISYPVPMMECEERPISLPMVTCQDITENKCITVPELMEDSVMVEKCVVEVGAPACQQVTLSLPNQVCRQIVYGAVHH